MMRTRSAGGHGMLLASARMQHGPRYRTTRSQMKKTNDSYCITFNGERTTERYYRDAYGWLKVGDFRRWQRHRVPIVACSASRMVSGIRGFRGAGC